MTEGDGNFAVPNAALTWQGAQPLDAIVIERIRCPLHGGLQSWRQATREARERGGIVEVGDGDIARARGDEGPLLLQLLNQIDRFRRLWPKEGVIPKDCHLIRLQRRKSRDDRLECGEVAMNI